MYTFEVKIRLAGRVSYVEVTASDSAQARMLVAAQYGDAVTILRLYYNRGELVSGGKGKIAMWLLDTDYDERSLFPRQVFFPMAGGQEGWMKLLRDIRAELNEDLLAQFHGTVSLPFPAGDNRRVAVKIVDDRGIESLKIIALP